MSTLQLIRSDLRAMIADRGHGPTKAFAAAVLKVLLYPRIQAVVLYRVGHTALSMRLTPIAYLMQAWSIGRSGAEIHPAATIGPGFCLFHSVGLVIGDRVKIGRGFRCFHGVTLGDNGQTQGQPTIGDDVTIYAGAVVAGPITIGDGAVIAANSVVLTDVPAGATVAGVPGKVVGNLLGRPGGISSKDEYDHGDP